MRDIRRGQLEHDRVELVGRGSVDHEPDVPGLRAGEGVAREHQPLRPLRSDVVEPHVGRGDAHGAHRRESDGGVVGRHDEVAVQREVGPTGEAVPLHLGDDGQRAVPEAGPPVPQGEHGRHVAFDGGVLGEVAGVRVLRNEAVARGEGSALCSG